MRVLVTNDDGVDAPGLAALTRALVGWADASAAAGGPRHEIVVVAPNSNYSGAGAAVGSVSDGTRVPYRRATISGAEGVEAFGLDASPALSVIAGALGAIGPKPDLVLSGINHGVNVGRSVLHSGTVGAALTASQLGISALAVSLRSGAPEPWASAADLAVALIPLLARAPARTVLNLNVPSLPLHEIRGLRWARVSGAGLIKAADGAGGAGGADAFEAPTRPEMEGPAVAEGTSVSIEGGPGAAGAGAGAGAGGASGGAVVFRVGSPFPRTDDMDQADPTEDATLVARGYAALTALRGPGAEADVALFRLLDDGLAAAVAPLGMAG